MSNAFTVIPVPGPGAEDVVVATSGPDAGAVFTGTEDGSIFRVGEDGAKVDLVAQTGGRPLGIEFAPDGRLLVCDALRGLLWVDPASGEVELITAEVDGVPMRFCNNAAIADDGTIWWSDSSTRFGIARWKHDFVRNTRTGRLLRRDPDGTVTVVLEGLAFANGVALSADGDFVCVAETGARTVVRHWISGPRAGTRDFLATDLPGYPDNIARGSDGLIWITIASPKDPLVERLQTGPMLLRKLATMLPEALQPKPKQSVRVVAHDTGGALVHDVDVTPADHGASYHMVTGVREHDGRLWMGSLHEPAIAVYDL
ncbi:MULTISPECIES: SMP-30/gluconolactonase/LRE family protein [unclassified Nocardioides]|jgi:sugar lactone lactonase YvrE|uniref:SMP-30/gluconolactonase/LRE family protein n=1 Tax=unclassified Nocardioides TaxID=2615069 RepID=UPI0007036855|nr:MULTISPECIES: SMP-30/gluconolactonase/LRE family protein [unclassified Nocardioides]KRC58911.1 strictosidine synthase [Nocardioides sp. Root79]KRC76767.1 strictosidine synthase [Nocardioides sp. Root240]